MPHSVIRIENLTKEYRLGVISHRMLTRDLQSWFARLRGAEDPNTPVAMQQAGGQSASERFWALRDVSFNVQEGEVVGIIGRNGAGKSTLLKILSRITAPTSGTVKIKGRVASLLEVGTGFHPELTGRENIFLNGAILGMSRQEVRRRFDAIVAFSEIERFIDTPVKRYSSGMYVRLAFAVAAHLEPEILIVDEVLAVGDAVFQQKCLGKMGEVAGSGRTVLFVSHNMQAVRNLCHRAILLEGGSLTLTGTAVEVVDAYLAGALHHETNIDIPQSMHRVYPPDLEIFKVELLNSSYEQTAAVPMDEPFALRFHFKIHEPGIGYRLGVVFYSADQTRIATVITSFGSSCHFYGERGPLYSLTATLDNIFMDGQYQFGIHIKNSVEKAVDVIENIPLTILPVASGQISSRERGVVRLRSSWDEPMIMKE